MAGGRGLCSLRSLPVYLDSETRVRVEHPQALPGRARARVSAGVRRQLSVARAQPLDQQLCHPPQAQLSVGVGVCALQHV